MKTFQQFISESDNVFRRAIQRERDKLNINKPPSRTGSITDPKFQAELEARRKREKEKKAAKIAARKDEIETERTKGRGIRAIQNGIKGWIKNGVFTPGPW